MRADAMAETLDGNERCSLSRKMNRCSLAL